MGRILTRNKKSQGPLPCLSLNRRDELEDFMTLMWGWGPFALKPRGDEFQAADRLRTTLRLHKKVISEELDSNRAASETDISVPSSPESLAATEALIEDGKSLAAVIEERFGSRHGLESIPSLGLLVMKATLAASALSIEYEIEEAKIIAATGDDKGLICWEVRGTARDTATNRSSPSFTHSERFDRADEVLRESQFLVAACRAYVEAINGIADIGRGEEKLFRCPQCSRDNTAPSGLPTEIYCTCGHVYSSWTRLRSS